LTVFFVDHAATALGHGSTASDEVFIMAVKYVGVKFSLKTFEKLKVVAEQKDGTISQVVREAVAYFLRQTSAG
jgi:hypothetical protein